MNIVIFLWPYKQKMPSARPFAFSIVLPSLIYYFLQEIRTEVPKYFWIRCKSPVQTSNAQRRTPNVRGSAGGGARTHTALRPLDFESSASANSATPACSQEHRHFACAENSHFGCKGLANETAAWKPAGTQARHGES